MNSRLNKYKILIIGSGAGCGAILTTLVDNGYKPSDILILEKGNILPQAHISTAASRFISTYENAGVVPCFGKPIIPFALANCLGGGPEINGGLIWKTPYHIQKEWFNGSTLPFDKEIFNKYLEYFEKLLSVKDSHIHENHDYASFLLKKTSDKMNIHCVPARRALLGSCCSQNLCAFGATEKNTKQTINEVIIQKYKKLGLKIECQITNIDFKIHERSGPYNISYRKEKKIFNITVDKIFLCAGTLNSPFLVSKIKKEIFSNFTVKFHINLKTIGLRKEQNPDVPGTMFSAQVQEYQKDDQYIMPFNWHKAHVASILDRHNQEINLSEVYKNGVGLTTQISHRDLQANLRICSKFKYRIRFLHHNLEKNDKILQVINKALKRTYNIYANMNISKVLSPEKKSKIQDINSLIVKEIKSIGNLDTISVHHMGSLPLESKYVSSNGSIRGYPNIFVADGSLLPTAVGESPQLTIMAFVSALYDDIK